MRSTFIIFFSIFFTVYVLLNLFVIKRAVNLLPLMSPLRLPLALILTAFAISFIFGHFLSRTGLLAIAEPLEWIGSFWVGAAFYLLLIFVSIDIIKWVTAIETITRIARFLVPILVTAILIFGFINSRIIRTTHVDIKINKPNATGRKNLNIVMLSDIHLGVMMDKCRFDHMVTKVNALNPDIIFLVGDILDQDVSQVIRKDLGASLLKLKAPLGIYGCTGNHEYIGGIEKASAYIESHNIKLLQDTMVTVDNLFQLAGRKDLSVNRFSSEKRKSLKEIMQGRNSLIPLVLLDHQPIHLEEAMEAGVDLQLSGHTHHGQMWPVSLITGKIFEKDYGYLKKGGTNYYVSSGAGTWGPPLRIGSVCEIVQINVVLKE